MLQETGGMQIPMSEDAGTGTRLRDLDSANQATFPPAFVDPPEAR